MSIWGRLQSWLITPAIAEQGPHAVHRAWVLIAILPLMAVHVAVVSAMLVADRVAFAALVLCALVAMGLAVVQGMRKTGALFATANLAAALVVVGLTLTILGRGGLHAPAAMGMAFVPLAATFLAGSRSGVVWAVIILLDIGVLTAVSQQGIVTDFVSEQTGNSLLSIGPALATLVALGMALAFQRSLLQAFEEAKRRERESAQAQAEARLAQAARMASVGQLAAGVAHEVNNPLSYVLGNLEWVLEKSEELPLDVTQALLETKDGAERVRSIVRDLKTFSREEEETCHSADVQAAIDTALKMVANELRHRATLKCGSASDLPRVDIEENRLVQVLINLLLNAAQAIEDGRAEDNEVEVRVAGADDGVHLIVRDTGQGMDAATLDQVFEPFFTTKPIGVGTGLGLSVCRNLIEASGGTLHLRSEPGSGTQAEIWLPAADPSLEVAPTPEARPQSRPVAKGEPRRVLIVDDDEKVRRAIVRTLKKHDVVEVAGGQEALAYLRADADFHLVLCDLMMPNGSGIDLYRDISSIRPDLLERFVFMTGGTFTEEAQDFLQRVPNRSIDKPFDLDVLRDVVGAA